MEIQRFWNLLSLTCFSRGAPEMVQKKMCGEPPKFETLSYDVKGGVAHISLNRAERDNAINALMSHELPLMWECFKRDTRAVVALMTGEGKRAFCTGADLTDLPQIDMRSAEIAHASMRWTALQNDVWKPVVCAVNGMAVGGGLHFIADSDIVLAAESASFFDTHVKVGLVSGLEPVGLARRMPMQAVLRMALMGGRERLSAQDALNCGLVGEVVPDKELMARATELATLLAKNSPSAMARSKRSIWMSKQLSLDAALRHAWQEIIEHNKTYDFDEGTRAFVEKRSPRWQLYRGD